MTTSKTQKHIDKVLTLINVVEVIQGVSLTGYFLDIAQWRASIEEKDYATVLKAITQVKTNIDAFNPKPDIVQIFDQIERDLLKAMICSEQDMQSSLGTVVISVYSQSGRFSNDFEREIDSFHYESKGVEFKKIINTLTNNPFKGSDMIITLIDLIIESNERVTKLDSLISK